MGLLNIAIALDSILTLQGVLIQKIHGFFVSNHAILLIWTQFQTGNFLRASQETPWFSNYVINTPLVAPMTSVVAWISIFVAGRHCCCLWNAMLVAWLILSSSELTMSAGHKKKHKNMVEKHQVHSGKSSVVVGKPHSLCWYWNTARGFVWS